MGRVSERAEGRVKHLCTTLPAIKRGLNTGCAFLAALVGLLLRMFLEVITQPRRRPADRFRHGTRVRLKP